MFHTRAVILSTKPYREYDELVSLFAERFGKRTILARGSRKATSKLAASLHGTKIVRCSFVEGRGYPILTSIDYVQNDPRIEDFYSNYVLYAFLALCDDILYEGDVDEKLWDLMYQVVQTAGTTQEKEASPGANALGKRDWVSLYDGWLRSLLKALGVEEAAKHDFTERALMRKAFTEIYYRNPYPLEPFVSLRETFSPTT